MATRKNLAAAQKWTRDTWCAVFASNDSGIVGTACRG
jgi:hypothetical protein